MTDTLQEAVALLERTPGLLRHLLRDLPAPWLERGPEEESWSAFDVVGHLIEGERELWIPRARILLGRDGTADRQFAPFDRFAMLERNQGRRLSDLLDEFAAARSASLETLAQLALTPADLARAAEHPALGRVTLQQLLATWVVHDLNHLRQICEALAARYRDEVGPWRQFLPILHDAPT